MINIGINGLGRIGKSIFIQSINNKLLNIKAINVPNLDINNLKSYLEHDSTHHYNTDWNFKILDDTTFSIKGKTIYLLNNRDPKKLNWKDYGITYVIDSTGAFLTNDKCKEHNVDYIIMCAPPKDDTSQFIVNVNHKDYNGENIVSNSSCTTNSICTILNFLENNYGIIKGNFTTIHSTTASQNTIDTTHISKRTSRSILNNIIPHTTGASKSILKIIPNLRQIKGTSLRVPVSNVSIIDLNITLKNKVNFKELFEKIEKENYIKINYENLVSGDFNTTTCPCIIDKTASIQLDDNEFKLMIWYDNEWSYSNQVIKLVNYMIEYNDKL